MWNKGLSTTDPERSRLIRNVLIMVLIVAVVCGALALYLFRDEWNLDSVRRLVKYGNHRDGEHTAAFSFDAHNSNRYADLKGGLAVASVSGLNTYFSEENEAIVSQCQMSLPQVQTGGDIAMAYDVGGSSLIAVHRSEGEVLRIITEREILDADLSSNGDICYVTSEAGFKSVLEVYNRRQERIYRWLSSSTYLPVCAVSGDGKTLAAIGLNQQSGSYTSELNFFCTDSEEITAKAALGSDLFYDAVFVKEDLLCAVGETGVRFYNTAASPVGAYHYGGSFLKDYDCGGDGFLALSLNMYRAGNRYRVVTVDHSGQQLGSCYIGQEILDLSVAGRYVAVLTSDSLTIFDRNMSVYAKTKEIGAATAVLMRTDGSALLLGGDTGRLYLP